MQAERWILSSTPLIGEGERMEKMPVNCERKGRLQKPSDSLNVFVVVFDRKAMMKRCLAVIEADRQVLGLQTKPRHVTLWLPVRKPSCEKFGLCKDGEGVKIRV